MPDEAKASSLASVAEEARCYGIKHLPKENDYQAQLKAFTCEKWWFRNFKRLQKQALEQLARNLELVHKHRSAYSSNLTLENRLKEKALSRLFLESTFVTNEIGQEFSLAELSDKNISNPAIRRAELMVRVKGFEQLAEYNNHVGLFVTITAPSRFHQITANGKPNAKYNGSTPADVQEFLNNDWIKIRSAYNKKEIHPYGFRVAEPHHDATPHWHMLLFVHPEEVQQLVDIFKHYALKDADTTNANLKHRLKVVHIDKNRGSAAGYIAKYIAKNIDGFGIDEDLEGNDAKVAAQKIEAWASTWNIRQFQQIGGAPVTVWRELRKLKNTQDDELLESARQAADASDWAAYNLLMGGANLPRSARPIQPYYEEIENGLVYDLDTAEVVQLPKQTKKLKGLICNGEIITSRIHEWKLSGSLNSTSSRSEQFEFIEQCDLEYDIEAQFQNHLARARKCEEAYLAYEHMLFSEGGGARSCAPPD
ncbi:replication endonuclease [Catenovulum agarivorans]|uniref:replication endonuclease n=1 Tax=Catenovulum agarivorans TaxID=1172192 RepID=UPI00035FF865